MVSIVRNNVFINTICTRRYSGRGLYYLFYNLFLMCLLLVLREHLCRNVEIISQEDSNVRSKVYIFFFIQKKNHDLGLKKITTLKKNLYYGIVSRERKFDVKRYCSQTQFNVQ